MNYRNRASLQLVISVLRMTEFLLLAGLFVWTMRLRQTCSCAVNHTLTLMQVTMVGLLATTMVPESYGVVHAVMVPVIAVYLWAAYTYVKDLEAKPDCECSGGSARKTLEVVTAVQGAIFLSVLAFLLLRHAHNVGKRESPMYISTPTMPFHSISA